LFKDEAEALTISPCHHVRKGQPPTFVVHGKADPVVPYENSERFARLMEEAGNACELMGFDGQRHGMCNRPGVKGVTQETWDAWTSRALKFFAKHGLAP
jgi:dipeptidyl aminopeptidase/acylaminoacyl peptidase